MLELICVEVKKIMTSRPKETTQWANLMTSNHKRDEFTAKKKDGKPKSFEAQKPMERKDLASQDQGVEESPVERAGLGSLGAAKGLGSLGRTTQLR